MSSAKTGMKIQESLSMLFLLSYELHAEAGLLEPSFILTWIIVVLKQLDKNSYPDYKYS